MSSLSKNEMKVLRSLFDMAVEWMANSSCNDIPSSVQSLMTEKEWKKLFAEIDEDTNSDNEYYGADWIVFQHLFDKLSNRDAK